MDSIVLVTSYMNFLRLHTALYYADTMLTHTHTRQKKRRGKEQALLKIKQWIFQSAIDTAYCNLLHSADFIGSDKFHLKKSKSNRFNSIDIDCAKRKA